MAATTDELWPIYNRLWALLGNGGPRKRELYGNRRVSDAARSTLREALFRERVPVL